MDWKTFLATVEREQSDPEYARKQRWAMMMREPDFRQKVAALERMGIAHGEDADEVEDLYYDALSDVLEKHPIGGFGLRRGG